MPSTLHEDLRAGGFTAEQADALVRAFDKREERLVVKKDLAVFEERISGDLKALEERMNGNLKALEERMNARFEEMKVTIYTTVGWATAILGFLVGLFAFFG